MINRHKSSGISTWSMMGIAGMAGFCILFLIKIAPIYLENYSVQSVLEQLESEGNQFADARKKDIRTTLNKRFTVNNIRSVRKDHVTIKKTKEDFTIIVKYEVRVPLISNIDVVPHFHHEFTKTFSK